MEKNLTRAVELNPSLAAALAALAEVRAALGRPFADAVSLVTRAVMLEPSDPWVRDAEVSTEVLARLPSLQVQRLDV